MGFLNFEMGLLEKILVFTLQPRIGALRCAAQVHPSDQLHPTTTQTKDVLQTVTTLQDEIPAHPTQQTLYATTVED